MNRVAAELVKLAKELTAGNQNLDRFIDVMESKANLTKRLAGKIERLLADAVRARKNGDEEGAFSILSDMSEDLETVEQVYRDMTQLNDRVLITLQTLF